MANALTDYESIIERIRIALSDYYLQNENVYLESIEEIQKSQRPFSNVSYLRVKTSKGIQRLVMKTTAHHFMNKAVTEKENQAVVEYNIISKLYPKFKEVEKCSVPRPIFVIPEIETYVMEFEEGKLLADEHRYIQHFSSKEGFNNLRDYYFCCGKWLKHFQEFTGFKRIGAEALSGIIEKCDFRLKLIEESKNTLLPLGLRSKIMNFMNEQVTKLSDEMITACGRHGDFGPWNMLVGPNGITVIDFLGFRDEPLPVDLLQVLVFLEDEKYSLTCSGRRVKTLERSFLEGYGGLPDIPFPVLVACETMQRVYRMWGAISRAEKLLHHRLEAHLRIKKHLRWLMNDKEPKSLVWYSF